MKRITVFCAAAIFSTLAMASESGGKEAAGPCKTDAEKLCPDVQPGNGRIAACLREHRDAVSDACKANIRKHRGQHGPHGGGDSKEGSEGS